MSAYVIGLTGGIACGKSNLSSALRSAGARIIDADEIVKTVTGPGGEALPAIRRLLGDRAFDGETLNRRALAAIIFHDEQARHTLNGIVHPIVLRVMREEIDKSEQPVVLDVPLLYECGVDAWCDTVWCAYLPQKEQAKRLMARDGLSYREALRRIRVQMPVREKARRADRVIRTDGSREESAALVLSLWRSLPPDITHKKGETL